MKWLTLDEVRRLTGKKRSYKAMRRVLEARGIRHDVSERGEPLVPVDYEQQDQRRRQSGPRWDRIGKGTVTT